jgi:Bacterial regulatory proteins, luxR family
MIAPKMPSRTPDNTTSQSLLSQFRRHFRCSHADQMTGPSTDSGLVSEDLSNKQIADALTVSARTIEGHIYRICAKLGVSTRAELAQLITEFAHRGPSQPNG